MNDTVIIFYAGHAKQTEDGNNALLPCAARNEDPAEITIQYIHALIEAKQTPLRALGFIIDGCRTHGREPLPALGNWRLPSIPNSFYCFACGPGQTDQMETRFLTRGSSLSTSVVELWCIWNTVGAGDFSAVFSHNFALSYVTKWNSCGTWYTSIMSRPPSTGIISHSLNSLTSADRSAR